MVQVQLEVMAALAQHHLFLALLQIMPGVAVVVHLTQR
jgi:hypothetical protein